MISIRQSLTAFTTVLLLKGSYCNLLSQHRLSSNDPASPIARAHPPTLLLLQAHPSPVQQHTDTQRLCLSYSHSNELVWSQNRDMGAHVLLDLLRTKLWEQKEQRGLNISSKYSFINLLRVPNPSCSLLEMFCS